MPAQPAALPLVWLAGLAFTDQLAVPPPPTPLPADHTAASTRPHRHPALARGLAKAYQAARWRLQAPRWPPCPRASRASLAGLNRRGTGKATRPAGCTRQPLLLSKARLSQTPAPGRKPRWAIAALVSPQRPECPKLAPAADLAGTEGCEGREGRAERWIADTTRGCEPAGSACERGALEHCPCAWRCTLAPCSNVPNPHPGPYASSCLSFLPEFVHSS